MPCRARGARWAWRRCASGRWRSGRRWRWTRRPAAERRCGRGCGRAGGVVAEPPAVAEPRIRVLLVDDHLVVRHGLRAFLQLQPDIEVAGEAGGGEAAVAAAAASPPDVVLMDLV